MDLQYGDKITFAGKYIEPEGDRNYKGFNYKEYLKTKKIYGSFKTKDNVEFIGKNKLSKTFIYINRIREKIIKNTKAMLPEESSEIFLGLLLGKKDAISEENIKSFKLSNMSHILSVSGMHTSYIILGLTYLLTYIPRRKRYIAIIAFLIFFMFLTNFVPSVVRAVIMAIMVLIAKLLYKKVDFITSISISLLILIIYNPYLIRDVGVLLSFLGTLGIILFSNQISFNLAKNLNKKVADILAVSFSAQILIFPITIYNFNMFSLSFILSSFICAILVGVVLIYGFINILMSFFFEKIAMCLAIILNIMLEVLIYSSNLIANIKFLNFTITTPKVIIIIFYYIAIIIIKYIIYTSNKSRTNLRRYKKRIMQTLKRINKKKTVIIAITIIVIICTCNLIYRATPKDLRIHFIDVGQGDSTLIISPKGKTMLIDAGEDKQIVLPYLLDRGIKKIDYILISHFDSDHARTE